MQDDEESINTNIDLEDKYENMGSDSEKEQDSDSESHRKGGGLWRDC